jgi:hypothetical protein
MYFAAYAAAEKLVGISSGYFKGVARPRKNVNDRVFHFFGLRQLSVVF